MSLVKIYKYVYSLPPHPYLYHCTVLLTKHWVGGRGSNLFGMMSSSFLSWSFFALFSLYIFRSWYKLLVQVKNATEPLLLAWYGWEEYGMELKRGCGLKVIKYRSLMCELPIMGDECKFFPCLILLGLCWLVLKVKTFVGSGYFLNPNLSRVLQKENVLRWC